MPDGGVHQQVDCQPLFGRAPVQPEHVAVTLHEPDLLVGAHPAQGGSPLGEDHQAGVRRHLGRLRDEDRLVAVQGGDFLLARVDFRDAGPARVLDEFVAVLVGLQPHGRGLDAHREVLGHHRDVAALVGEVLGDGEDPAVVVPAAETGGQHLGGDVVQLHHEGAAVVAKRDGAVQPVVLHPQVIEEPERLAGKVAEFGIVPLAFEFGDDDDRQDHFVLREAQQGPRIREQHRGVDHEAPGRFLVLLSLPRKQQDRLAASLPAAPVFEVARLAREVAFCPWSVTTSGSCSEIATSTPAPGRMPGIVIGEAARPGGRTRPPIHPVRTSAPCTGLPDQPAVCLLMGLTYVRDTTFMRQFFGDSCCHRVNTG